MQLIRRRTIQGKAKPEIIRCLKRYVAREIYQTLPTMISNNNSSGPGLANP